MNTTEIFPKGQPLPKEWFSGNAFVTPLVAKDTNNEFSAGSVTFEAKARTNWHTHPKGQVLIVIYGEGYYQEKGKPAQHIKKGDVVNIPEQTSIGTGHLQPAKWFILLLPITKTMFR